MLNGFDDGSRAWIDEEKARLMRKADQAYISGEKHICIEAINQLYLILDQGIAPSCFSEEAFPSFSLKITDDFPWNKAVSWIP